MRTERGLDRLITFLDAVVAIAITVLVLPLSEVLESPTEELGALLADERSQFGAFLLSFVVIARLWLVHHRLVERIGAYDRAFLLVNLAWVLTIVLLPFVTQATAIYGADRLAVALYIGTMTASSALLTGLALLMWRRPALCRADEPEPFPASAVATTAIFAGALVLGVAVPSIGYWALLALFATDPVERVLRRRAGAAGD
ncbi:MULTISPECIES: TMEM175 family protein [unclassified Blastococcus]